MEPQTTPPKIDAFPQPYTKWLIAAVMGTDNITYLVGGHSYQEAEQKLDNKLKAQFPSQEIRYEDMNIL